LAKRLVFLSPQAASRLKRLAGWLPGGFARQLENNLGVLERSLQLVVGRPNETALPLCYWRGVPMPGAGQRLDPARDGCGLMWYAPLVIMKPERVSEYVAMVESIMRAYGLEPLITFTSISERCFDSTVPLLFDVASDESRANAQACYRALFMAGKERGFLPYRVGIQAMEWLSEGGDPTYWQVVRQIKDTLDPDGILAPGRYL